MGLRNFSMMRRIGPDRFPKSVSYLRETWKQIWPSSTHYLSRGLCQTYRRLLRFTRLRGKEKIDEVCLNRSCNRQCVCQSGNGNLAIWQHIPMDGLVKVLYRRQTFNIYLRIGTLIFVMCLRAAWCSGSNFKLGLGVYGFWFDSSSFPSHPPTSRLVNTLRRNYVNGNYSWSRKARSSFVVSEMCTGFGRWVTCWQGLPSDELRRPRKLTQQQQQKPQ